MTLPHVPGFRFAGVSCGIKPEGKLDLGAIVADAPVPTAAVFTTNRVCAAPVKIARERVRGGMAQAILVNSGNANACTGKAGHDEAVSSVAEFADALGVDAASVLPASTGVIGVTLQGDRIRAGVPRLVDSLGADPTLFSEAILTTDIGTKTAARTITIGRKKATILGIAKGAGMIHPTMATTLGFVTTDAPVSKAFLKRALKRAIEPTFNRISVDGDTSTNDMVALMASGQLGGARLTGKDRASERFEKALTEVLLDLGKAIVRDGEGAQHCVRIEVRGGESDNAALKVAKTIAQSLLVKTAIHGKDPNWGRILAAAGRAGVAFEEKAVEVKIGDIAVYRRGLPVMDAATEAAATKVMEAEEYGITFRLGKGKARAHYYTSDLGHGYVSVNADYRS